MWGDSRLPPHGGLVSELRLVRERGPADLRRLHLPLLRQAAELAGMADGNGVEPAAVLELLLKAVDTLDGGRGQEAAEYTFGLAHGTKLWSAQERRRRAAEIYGITPETFRKEPERQLVDQVAEGVLDVLQQVRMRQTRLNMERRHPAESRLAVQWVERFEAYYRIWTPIYALQADLKAAIATLREEPSAHLPWDPTSEASYEPGVQAQGYARHALYDYAWFKLELRRFMDRHGGLWLFSDADVEQKVADATYRIGWHNSFNAEDDGWLRRQLRDSRHEEQDHFAHLLQTTQAGQRILDDWWGLIVGCRCGGSGKNPLLTCQTHLTVQACLDYTGLVDDDWRKIADWYHVGGTSTKSVHGADLWADFKKAREDSESTSTSDTKAKRRQLSHSREGAKMTEYPHAIREEGWPE